MGYFDDLTLVHAQIIPHCPVEMDKRYPRLYSIEFNLSGRMHYAVDDGPAGILAGPALFWHHPRHTYQYGPADAEGWHHHYVSLHGPRARRILEEGFLPLSPRGTLPVRDGRAFAGYFRLIAQVVAEPGRGRQAEAVIAVEQILRLAQAEAASAAGMNAPAGQQKVIAEVARAVEDDPLRPYDFAREAAAGNLSYSHFRRLFRLRTGLAPHAYLLRCRMRLAARLLAQPQRQIKEVARECGYEDAPGFSRVFRQQIGLSPAQYRAANLVTDPPGAGNSSQAKTSAGE